MAMLPGGCLELTRTLTALARGDSPVLCKLGRGTVLTVAGIMRESGLIDAMCVGKLYTLFAVDLEEASQRSRADEKLIELAPGAAQGDH